MWAKPVYTVISEAYCQLSSNIPVKLAINDLVNLEGYPYFRFISKEQKVGSFTVLKQKGKYLSASPNLKHHMIHVRGWISPSPVLTSAHSTWAQSVCVFCCVLFLTALCIYLTPLSTPCVVTGPEWSPVLSHYADGHGALRTEMKFRRTCAHREAREARHTWRVGSSVRLLPSLVIHFFHSVLWFW